jgi:hypothetical protein
VANVGMSDPDYAGGRSIISPRSRADLEPQGRAQSIGRCRRHGAAGARIHVRRTGHR